MHEIVKWTEDSEDKLNSLELSTDRSCLPSYREKLLIKLLHNPDTISESFLTLKNAVEKRFNSSPSEKEENHAILVALLGGELLERTLGNLIWISETSEPHKINTPLNRKSLQALNRGYCGEAVIPEPIQVLAILAQVKLAMSSELYSSNDPTPAPDRETVEDLYGQYDETAKDLPDLIKKYEILYQTVSLHEPTKIFVDRVSESIRRDLSMRASNRIALGRVYFNSNFTLTDPVKTNLLLLSKVNISSDEQQLKILFNLWLPLTEKPPRTFSEHDLEIVVDFAAVTTIPVNHLKGMAAQLCRRIEKLGSDDSSYEQAASQMLTILWHLCYRQPILDVVGICEELKFLDQGNPDCHTARQTFWDTLRQLKNELNRRFFDVIIEE